MTMRDRRVVWFVVVGAAGILSAALAAAPGPPPRVFQRGGVEVQKTVWDGIYTEAQAARGAVLFDKDCAGCHGPSGEGGGMAPALVEAAFGAGYDGQTVGDLFDRNRATMPPGREGQMSAQQTADITAAMLQFNKFPAGETELPSQSMMLKGIKYIASKPYQEKH